MAGVYLPEAPGPPPPPRYTLYEYLYPCSYSRREGGGDEPVRRLEGRKLVHKRVENTNMNTSKDDI